jgi:hypothetical protein
MIDKHPSRFKMEESAEHQKTRHLPDLLSLSLYFLSTT